MAIGALAAWGCARERSANLISNAGLEAPLQSNGMPRDWKLSTATGTYRVTGTEAAHSGKSAVVLAGSAGSAELNTPVVPIPGAAIVECECWMQAELLKNARAFARAAFGSDPNLKPRSPIFAVDPRMRGWQHAHFCCIVRSGLPKIDATLVVALHGDGLVRVDDVALRVLPPTALRYRLADGGFDQSSRDGRLGEWTFLADGAASAPELTADPSEPANRCVRLRGDRGWSVLSSRQAMAPADLRIFAQGRVWVHEGHGELKIDYLKDGKCVASTRSELRGTDGWRFVSVEGAPEFARQADDIHVSLGAGNPAGLYFVDFDDIEIVVLD